MIETKTRLHDVLADMKERRGGFLLPHHGIMGLLDPDSLALYDKFYSRLALTDGPFSELEKEYIWLAIIIAGREAIGTHHLHKFRAAAEDAAAFASVLRLVAIVEGSDAILFPHRAWSGHQLGLEWTDCYEGALLAACRTPEIADWLIHAGAAAVATCGRRWPQLAHHLKRLYAAGVPERNILEALMFTMLPAGAPNFINACAVWQLLARDKAIPASELTAEWANQQLGGFGTVLFPNLE